MLSVIIPARNEQHLERTIQDVLSNARGPLEIVVILDGWAPTPPIQANDDRVSFHYFESPIGQRAAVNYGVKVAKGSHIMKLDAHCAVAEGFDVQLMRDAKEEWTQVPRMYNLDVATWKPKLHKRTDYMYFSAPTAEQPFRAQYYRKQPTGPDIDDTMCCMGPGWFMSKSRYEALGGLDEAHGGWGQMGIEVALKAWLSGGALKVNKRTWFAHWFRGDVGFPYPISGHDVERARKHSQELWLENKWPLAIRSLAWVVQKFDAPTWDAREVQLGSDVGLDSLTQQERQTVQDFHLLFHRQWNRYPRKWCGTRIVKYPQDLFLYHMIIAENRPDVIIETGAFMGGSALFFAQQCEAIGHGYVFSIDRRERRRPSHPRLSYVIGRSTAVDTLAHLKEAIGGGSCMAILDSDHRRPHVKRELSHYSKLVTKGQYLVVEDVAPGSLVGGDDGPAEAMAWFKSWNRDFVDDHLELNYLTSMNGWLRRAR